MHSPLQSPLQPVMRSPLEFRRRGGGSFDIASTNPSAYYDRTVLATLFQDSAGTTPVTDIVQSIGYGGDLSGNSVHQIQATAGKRPISSKRINRLIKTEAPSDSIWQKYKCSVADAIGHINADYAFKITESSTTDTHLFRSSAGQINLTAGTITAQAILKSGGRSRAQINISDSGNGASARGGYDLSTVTLLGTGTSGATSATQTITDLGGGEFLCTLTSTHYSGIDSFGICLLDGASSPTAGFPSYAGDGVSGVYCAEMQIQYGANATRYQRINTAGDYDTAGFQYFAEFDHVDDDLVATFPASLGSGCTVCRSLPGTGASITTGVTLTDTYTDNVDAHALLIYTAAQWAALDAGQIANITTWLNGRAGL